jgi:sirohydrochlorin cobaltochelatase
MRHRRSVIVVGHGSRSHSEGIATVLQVVRLLRESPHFDFDDVRAAFWDEDPPLATIVQSTDAQEVVVVPFLMSQGYYATRIFPEQLGLDHPLFDRVHRVGEQDVVYTKPVGTHQSVEYALADCFREACRKVDRIPEKTSLMLVGHGTKRHEESSASVQAIAASLTKSLRCAGIHSTFLDQPPSLGEQLPSLHNDVIVIPMLMAHGFHTREDLPTQLGVGPESVAPHPTRPSKLVYLTEPFGSRWELQEMIEELACKGAALFDPSSQPREIPYQKALTKLLDFVPGSRWTFADLEIQRHGDTWRISKRGDAHHRDLPIDTVQEAWNHGRKTKLGQHRPIRAMNDLLGGWTIETRGPDELFSAIDQLYPGAMVDHFLGDGIALDGLQQKEEVPAEWLRPCLRCVKVPQWAGEMAESQVRCLRPCTLVRSIKRRANASARAEGVKPKAEDGIE